MSREATDYDVIVLGGGSAGTAAGRAAVAAGARTAVVNEGEIGGLCILRGCMPTKSMLEAAHVAHVARHTDPFGIRASGEVTADFAAIMERKRGHVDRFQRAKIEGVEAADHAWIDGRGRFVPGGGVEVDGRRLEAKAYVVASGSRPARPPIDGLDEVETLTSDDVMRLDSPPSSLLVYGAGAVGLELAQFFARIGTRVRLVNRSPLLSKIDPDAGRELHAALGEELDLSVPATIASVRPSGGGLNATIVEDGVSREEQVEALLLATGRDPELEGLGLEHVGLDPSGGGLAHDETMRTKNPAVWVAGDATGREQLLHVANQEGAAAGHNAAGGRPPKTIDPRLAMQAIFTDPPFAQVGLVPLAVDGRRIVEGRARFPETGRAITMNVRHGLWRLLVEADSGQVVGASILGPRADDLIHLVAELIHFRGTLDDVLELPWYHPTLSEVMLDLARSAAAARAASQTA